MYLTAKRYMSTTFRKEDGDKQEAIQKLFPELEGLQGRWGDNSCVKEVSIDAGYWRKANAIHDWFVRECQGGVDECQPSYVSREQLGELRQLCEEVLEDRTLASKLLPTTAGFFFGSTEYDEYYFQDIELTVKIIDSVSALPNEWEFEYRSSW
jgi:hypothetical protein